MEYITYRSELTKLDACLENNKIHHSIFSILIFKFLYWIKIKLNKRDGYIDFMTRGKDNMIMIDMLSALLDIVIDVKDQIILNKEQMEKFNNIEKIIQLIFLNLDKPIRTNPGIIYDEEEDEEDEKYLLQEGNMILKLENLISIDHYIDE